MTGVVSTDGAEAVAAAAAAVPGVRGLSSRVATHLPGRAVSGVRARDDRVEVHVVVAWGRRLADVADDVRRAASPAAGGREVVVHVEDLVLGGDGGGAQAGP